MKKERLLERFNDYKRASSRLLEATKLNIEDAIDNSIILDGVIQRFEFTFELSWKLMKAFLEYNGASDIRNPRSTIREAFSSGLIDEGEQWINMMIDQTKTSHLYDEDKAWIIYRKIKNTYVTLLLRFRNRMDAEIDSLE